MVKSAYIHIPFCMSICSYCDFCKFFYNKEWVSSYLEELKKEILEHYNGEPLDTLYVGGGTPSALSKEELENLLKILTLFQTSSSFEYTFECNIESLDFEKLSLLKKYGVNRLSIGVQTFHESLLKILNRHHTKEEVKEKIKLIKEMGFQNINVDLMYALPEETKKEVEEDIQEFLLLDVPHVSLYSLILGPNTKLYIQNQKPIDEDLDYEMYQLLEETLEKHGYIHYETSNYAKKGYESRHNLTYWNNLEYYGFGVGASGYVNGVRYENTRSFQNYIKGEHLLESHEVKILEDMQNTMILGLRKSEGVSKAYFEKKYHKKIEEVFDIRKLLEEQKLKEVNGFLFIPKEYRYLANEILIYFI